MSLALASRDPTQRATSSPQPVHPPDPGLHLGQDLAERLRCPACGSPLALARDSCVCLQSSCGQRFEVHGGVALLIDEKSSVFSPKQALSRLSASPQPLRGSLPRLLRNLLPALGANRVARGCLQTFRRLLLERGGARPNVLVIGGASVGAGMAALLEDSRIECVESDVWISARTHLVCDAHQIPFAAATFDGVVIQAVLEHVADPQRCVGEIHRVLRPGGLVYAETAFMQQVHAGRHDFCRFTAVGHRRLFRGFEQVAAGAAGGPAVALAWAWQHFLLSFTARRAGRAVATAVAVLTAFWLKYLDAYLLEKPAALDAASAYFFLGSRRETPLTDREALGVYPGGQNHVV
jgi:SAM-dependent methyltransferase